MVIFLAETWISRGSLGGDADFMVNLKIKGLLESGFCFNIVVSMLLRDVIQMRRETRGKKMDIEDRMHDFDRHRGCYTNVNSCPKAAVRLNKVKYPAVRCKNVSLHLENQMPLLQTSI